MSITPHSGIIDFGTFTSPTGGLDGIQGEVPAPLLAEAGYILSTNGWIPNPGSTSGTVTSVAMTVPTGLDISGSPITTSGTLAVTYAAGYAIPTTASQTNWDTAYTDRLKWDGGATGLVAATGRTSLGLGTSAVLNAGVAGGVATLDGGGTVPTSQLPAAVLGAVKYQGTWNASTNTPTLTSSTGTQGYYYVVSVAGSTNLDGITDWKIGDWAIYSGTAWQKIDNTDAVTSVNGFTGAVSLTTSNVAEGTSLYFTDARARLALSAGTGISYNNTTGVITNSAPDQVVSLTQGGTTTITGTYPNFTISSADAFLGTVTSVSGSGGTTGLTLTGGPITGSGTLTLGGTLAVANGGTGATTAATARTNLGATTVGGNLFTLTNPSAITFPRFNADNTVSALDAATFRTAIGAGTGSGTVTSVAALTLGTTGTDLSSTVATGTTTPVITLNVPTASATNRGALSSTDWSTFNGKQAALVSGTNIKTVGGVSLLGAGDVGTIGVGYGGTGTTTAFTAGSVVFAGASGVYSQDNANLFWDDTNNRLGVGDAAPAGKLSISAASGTLLQLSDGATQNFFTTITTGAGAAGAINFNANNGGNLIWQIGAAEKMRLDASGNVGIGTTSPIGSTGAGLTTSGVVAVQGYLAVHQTNAGIVEFNAGKMSLRPYGSAASPGYLTFTTGGGGGEGDTERLRIDASGRVGIGVTPSASTEPLLQMPNGGMIAMAGPYAHLIANAYYNVGWKYTTTATASRYEMDGSHKWFTAASGTAGTAISFTQAMTLDASGNLALGATSSSTRLTVADSLQGLATFNSTNANAGYVQFQSSGANFGYIGSGASLGAGTATDFTVRYQNNLLFNYQGTEKMRIDASGNVNIGSTGGTGKLDVRGVSGYLGYFRDTGTGGYASFKTDASGPILEYGNGSAGFRFSDGASERMRIDSAGNVGIGASPSYKLDVVGAGTQIARVYNNTTTADASFYAQNSTGIAVFGINATGPYMYTGSAVPLLFYASGFEKMRIHSSGGVSIGNTTDPGAGNVTANSFQDGYTTTATAAGTTTLTVASTGIQYFTGTTTQTVVLPVTSTLQLGWSYHVANTSTGVVTVQSSGANVITTIPPGLSVMFTCILTSGTTAASWDYGYTDFPAVTPVGSSSLNDSLFRLNANGSAIGPAIADYFGTNSAVTLPAAGVYELEFELYFTKTTAGTVTFTLTSDNAPVNLNAYWIGTAVGGVGTAAASPQAALVASTATAAALPATGSLTTAVNHHYIIRANLNSHATLAETIRLRVTSSAGTVTPLRGSMYRVRNLTTGNSGTFVA